MNTRNIATVALLFVLSSCSVSKKLAEPKEVVVAQEIVPESKALLIDGSRELAIGNNEGALRYFLQAIAVDSKNDAAHYEAAKLFSDAEDNVKALFHSERAALLIQDNLWYQTLYADQLSLNDRVSEGIFILSRAAKKNEKNIEIWYDLAYKLQQANRFDEAIEAYNHIETIQGVNASTSIRKNRLYTNMNDIDEGAQEILALIEQYPGEVRYIGFLAEYYEINSKLELSLEQYERLLSIDKNQTQALIAKADLLMLLDREREFKEAISDVIIHPDITLDEKVKVLYPLVDNLRKNPAFKEEYIHAGALLISEYPNAAKPFALYGDFLYNADELEGAANAYSEAIERNSTVFSVWEQLMFIHSGRRDMKELERVSARAMNAFPEEGLSFYMNGFANYSLGNYQQSVMALQNGVRIKSNADRLLAEMYSVLGDAHHSLDNHEQSDLSYDNSLLRNPDNVYVLNNYSYHLSMRDQNLTKAERMIARAVELDPENANVLDTYAWIKFRLGSYDEALPYMEKAIELDVKNGRLTEHYGDILFKLGRKAEAVKSWQKAVQQGRVTEILERKIREEQFFDYQ